MTHDARCKVALVRNVGVCPGLAWQASEDGFGVGERGLRRAWAGDAILNIIVDLILRWLHTQALRGARRLDFAWLAGEEGTKGRHHQSRGRRSSEWCSVRSVGNR